MHFIEHSPFSNLLLVKIFPTTAAGADQEESDKRAIARPCPTIERERDKKNKPLVSSINELKRGTRLVSDFISVLLALKVDCERDRMKGI